MLIALGTFLVDRNSGAMHSLSVSLKSGLLVMVLWGVYHAVTILWGLRIITGLHKHDPRIEVAFVDERKQPLAVQHSQALEVRNKGKTTALWVRIAPLKLTSRTIYFPDLVDSIEPTDYRRFHGEVGSEFGYDSHHDLARAMNQEWASRHDHETNREVIVPMRADYEDVDGVRYEVLFELIHHGGTVFNQPQSYNCMECRKFSYRRIVTGGFRPSGEL